MNHQPPQPQFVAARPKRLRVYVRNPCRAALPHSRAGRKDLQCVAAQFPRRFQRVQITPRDGGMNSDSKAPIHPRWREWFRLRFRAIFVFRVELRRLGKWLFQDSLGKFLVCHKPTISTPPPKPPRCLGFPLTNQIYLCRVMEWEFAFASRVRPLPSSRPSSLAPAIGITATPSLV